MMVDLSRKEIEQIDQALKTWAQEPHSSGILASLVESVTGKRLGKTIEQVKAEVQIEQAEATAECRDRERQTLMLRAKLFQACNRDSEHDLSPRADNAEEGR